MILNRIVHKLMNNKSQSLPPQTSTRSPTEYHAGNTNSGTVHRVTRSLGMTLLILLIGNLLVHLYAQDWHWVAVPVAASWGTGFSAILASFFLYQCWKHVRGRFFMPFDILLPSLIGGVMAAVAWFAGLPGLDSWTGPAHVTSFVREGELFFVPLFTLGQIMLLIRSYRMRDGVPF